MRTAPLARWQYTRAISERRMGLIDAARAQRNTWLRSAAELPLAAVEQMAQFTERLKQKEG